MKLDLARPGTRWRAVGAVLCLTLALAACSEEDLTEQGPPLSALPDTVVRIHYGRADADYRGWGLHLWDEGQALNLPRVVEWGSPWEASGRDDFGAVYDVPVKPGAISFNLILHQGDNKNCPNDQKVDLAQSGRELWLLQGDCTFYTKQPQIKVGNPAQAKAYWLTPDTLAWPGAAAGDRYRLYHAATGGISTGVGGVSGGEPVELGVETAGLAASVRERFPHLAGATALRLPAKTDARSLLRRQLVLARFDGNGRLLDATALQTAGVLDALYAEAAAEVPLGVTLEKGHPTFRLWAPTAQQVSLLLSDRPDGPETARALEYDPDSGIWSVRGEPAWMGRKHYRYQVEVFVRSSGRVETNRVTDPYSVALSADSTRSLLVDLDSAATKPAGWDSHPIPTLAAPEDISLYEMHLRDFSINDPTVPAADRGKYAAFDHLGSHGMRHLQALQQAGLTHLHLLPLNDISTIPERAAQRQEPVIDPNAAGDAEQQQAAVTAVQERDGFNWGYDPLHYNVPEGSYASDPDGIARIVEFRRMVQNLHRIGLRVALDVVYNHTPASGQDAKSVLDRIVPGYYQRLDEQGNVANSTCCANTATENAMMAKLMIDSAKLWARHYQIDAFRFDLMGHQPLAAMRRLKQEVDAIAGRDIYLYGEGWNFGEVQNDARFRQATQLNLAGSGIGSFSDRLRDAVRGGGPFDGGEDLLRRQGFGNGLCYDNRDGSACADWQREALLRAQDMIRLGLAGNLRDYLLTDYRGEQRRGEQFDYNGQPAGYTADPQELISYVGKHDNQTLFDIGQYRLPSATSAMARARAQIVSLSLVALGQGVPFFHAGDDLLRSKSLDRDSYNSGDWFNRIDWGYQHNNWAVGLPPREKNGDNWAVMKPLLADPALQVGPGAIAFTRDAFRDLLRLRQSTPLFRLRSAEAIKSRLSFPAAGPGQAPGLIAMRLDGSGWTEAVYRGVLVLFNADKVARTLDLPAEAAAHWRLHPVQASGSDPVVREAGFAAGRFTIPARTTAVFVLP
ncbi:pullulanase-type alpha-1,6-glucosidase [Chitinimonas lacunae]|uniref:Pullulanase-type alpha-1,6-glucosidase n=1 Tax=Chitinimonas lacunae TaxID=1963018 RepID=A0ABV8MKH0_9NEIS